MSAFNFARRLCFRAVGRRRVLGSSSWHIQRAPKSRWPLSSPEGHPPAAATTDAPPWPGFPTRNCAGGGKTEPQHDPEVEESRRRQEQAFNAGVSTWVVVTHSCGANRRLSSCRHVAVPPPCRSSRKRAASATPHCSPQNVSLRPAATQSRRQPPAATSNPASTRPALQ